MESPHPSLLAFSPLPPARNGIADYAVALLGGLAAHYRCTIACEDWLGEAPAGMPVVDPALAHRLPEAGGRVLHQMGNNPDHGFVLRALRQFPGVVTLHDPGLLHLHEVAGEGQAAILAGMRHAVPRLAETYAGQLREHGLSTRANHLLFDMAGEVLARSRAVVVHSRFALHRLRLTHGAAATGHVAVIPHPLPPGEPPGREAARARLGIPAGDFLVVTAGFASVAKRLDWVLAALQGLPSIRWIHAGSVEAGLAAAIGARGHVTGHVDAAGFADHIAAADVLVNLRFPSAGESSGSVARGLAAGVCCLVSDTGAYAELPRDAVVHLPLAGGAGALAEALGGLLANPGRAAAIGAAGRRFAAAEMALPAIAARYRDIIEASRERPVAPPPSPAPGPLLRAAADPARIAEALAGQPGACQLRLEVPDLAVLAELSLAPAGLLGTLLPAGARLRSVRVEPTGLLLDLELRGVGMNAAPLLAAWLAQAFPGLAARDLGLPAGHLLPWLPGVRAGLAEAEVPAAERGLLARFRQGGRPLLGLDPIADAMPDPAWDAAPERLVWRETPGPSGDASLALLHGGLGEAPVPAGMARIMLLAGSTAKLERHDLLLPEPRLAEVFGRLRSAAAGLAGPGWQLGGRLVSPRLASLGMLAPDPGGHVAVLALPAAGLPHDLPGPGLPKQEDLPLDGVARMRLLLGALPARRWRLRLGFAGAEPGAAAFFLDGLRQPARVEEGGWLAADITPLAGRALVLGLAWPGGAPAGLRLARVEARA